MKVRYTGPPTSILEELLIQDRLPLEILNVLWAAKFWKQTRNPRFMDYVQVYCHDEGLWIGPRLNAELVAAARLRQRGLAKGTDDGFNAKMLLFDKLTAVCVLTSQGTNRDDAIEKVVPNRSSKDVPATDAEPYTRDVLKRYYCKFIGKRTERTIHAAWDELEHMSDPRPF